MYNRLQRRMRFEYTFKHFSTQKVAYIQKRLFRLYYDSMVLCEFTVGSRGRRAATINSQRII